MLYIAFILCVWFLRLFFGFEGMFVVKFTDGSNFLCVGVLIFNFLVVLWSGLGFVCCLHSDFLSLISIEGELIAFLPQKFAAILRITAFDTIFLYLFPGLSKPICFA